MLAVWIVPSLRPRLGLGPAPSPSPLPPLPPLPSTLRVRCQHPKKALDALEVLPGRGFLVSPRGWGGGDEGEQGGHLKCVIVLLKFKI